MLAAALVALAVAAAGCDTAADTGAAGDTPPVVTTDPPGPNPACLTPGGVHLYARNHHGPCTDTADLSIEDRNWRLDWIQLKSYQTGEFHGTAQVTYTGDRVGCGCAGFTIRILDDHEFVAMVDGDALVDVPPGESVTIELYPTGRNLTNSYVVPQGPYTYTLDAGRYRLG